MIQDLKPLLGKLSVFAQKKMGFKYPPKLFLKQDIQNSNKALGKTAYYDPEAESITLFITARHPKDILRSFAHELVHHTQNLRGDLAPEKITTMGKNYAQECPHMRKMEQEAYLDGNMCFRDWEDSLENKDIILIKLVESKFLKENKTMTTKITKDFLEETIRKLLKEQPGPTVSVEDLPDTSTDIKDIPQAKADLEVGPGLKDAIEAEKAKGATYQELMAMIDDILKQSDGQPPYDEDRFRDKQDDPSAVGQKTFPEDEFKDDEAVAPKGPNESNEIFAPNHYCIHHGGVQHEGKIVAAEAIQHVEPDENGFVSHYDMKLPDGTILEDVAAEDIQITNAVLESSHGNKKGAGKRDHKPMKKKKSKSKGKVPKTEKEKKFAKLAPPKNRITFADKIAGATQVAEDKIQTPEQENTLYEQRFTPKNNRLFEKLLKEWTK